jgi:very-short-patch-repair endonuclease/predicted transcriptional regulator of viral defense system
MSAEWPIPDDIWPKSAFDRSDRALAEASRPQHHVLTLAQLERLGLSARAVRHRAASGRLVRIHGGVYGIGRPSREGRWMAAVLACGGDALLSHRSAAEHWGLLANRPGPVHVTGTTRRGRSRNGLVLHSRALIQGERAQKDGIPCTSVARTLLDVAEKEGRRELERAIEQAETLRLFDLEELRQTIVNHRGRRGVASLRACLDAYDGPSVTASEAEERLLTLLRQVRLPRPEVNQALVLQDGTVYRPDCLWRDARLIVEVDGRDYHARRRSFERDRVRDRRLALAGYETRRFAASEVFRRPGAVANEIAAFLRLARSRTVENGRHMAGIGHSAS